MQYLAYDSDSDTESKGTVEKYTSDQEKPSTASSVVVAVQSKWTTVDESSTSSSDEEDDGNNELILTSEYNDDKSAGFGDAMKLLDSKDQGIPKFLRKTTDGKFEVAAVVKHHYSDIDAKTKDLRQITKANESGKLTSKLVSSTQASASSAGAKTSIHETAIAVGKSTSNLSVSDKAIHKGIGKRAEDKETAKV